MAVSKPRTAFAVATAVALCGGLALGLNSWQSEVTGQERVAAGPRVSDEAAKPAVEHAKSLSTAFRHAAGHATPSVVKINAHTNSRPVRKLLRRGGAENPFKGTPFEEMIPRLEGLEGFEGRIPQRDGVGSGVIVDPAGVVLTNNHVVEGADMVTVRLSDGREFRATDIKTDPSSDLAVIRLKDAKDLPAAKLGDSDALEIGDWVIAIGNPFELDLTVSAGIISGKGRELSRVERSKFLQTDAAINPGNSGGPLVNLEGEVVGINTAIASNSGGYQGVGFAIPSNQAKWIMSQLIEKGTVQRSYLGIRMYELDSDLARQLNVPRGQGVVVAEVVPGSPADKAGVKEDDVVVKFSDQPILNRRDLQERVERVAVDSKHSLTVIRDGQSKDLSVTLKALPADEQRASVNPEDESESDRPASIDTFQDKRLGMELADQREEDSAAFKGRQGVLIRKVEEGGPASLKGLQAGMLIRKVGNVPVKNVNEYADAVKRQLDGAGVLLHISTPLGNRLVVVQPS